jgi:hypothetical protein
MKSFAALMLFALLVTGVAGSVHGATRTVTPMRTVDATDVCLSNCADQSASCKRACPATFTAPCISSCDSQEQVCRQACWPR